MLTSNYMIELTLHVCRLSGYRHVCFSIVNRMHNGGHTFCQSVTSIPDNDIETMA